MFLNQNIQSSDDFQTEIKKLKPYTLKEISDNYSKYFEEYKDTKKEKFNDEQINTCINFINNFNLKLNEYKENLVEFGEVKKTKIFRESRIATIFLILKNIVLWNMLIMIYHVYFFSMIALLYLKIKLNIKN